MGGSGRKLKKVRFSFVYRPGPVAHAFRNQVFSVQSIFPKAVSRESRRKFVFSYTRQTKVDFWVMLNRFGGFTSTKSAAIFEFRIVFSKTIFAILNSYENSNEKLKLRFQLILKKGSNLILARLDVSRVTEGGGGQTNGQTGTRNETYHSSY